MINFYIMSFVRDKTYYNLFPNDSLNSVQGK